ncbi:MAG: glycosyltransferase family 4 protein [Candidatus Omnitrophota bacterium]
MPAEILQKESKKELGSVTLEKHSVATDDLAPVAVGSLPEDFSILKEVSNSEPLPPQLEKQPQVNPLRIAILSWESHYSISVGGISAHVTQLALALARKGHEAHVFTRMGRPDHAQYELIDGVHYHRAPYPGHRDFLEDVNNMCRSFVTAVFQVEDYMGAPFDIVHAHDWLTSNAMFWIKKGRGRKGVLTIHSTEYGRCGNNFYGGPSGRIRDQERHGTHCADKVIAVSNALKKEMMWMYNLPDWKIQVIYNAVNCKDFDMDVDPGQVKMKHGMGPLDPMVLFAGRMTHQKGPDLLIEAVPFILRHYPNAKFVFAGEGHLRGAVENRARQLGVSHATRFIGHQENGNLRKFFKACECVCVPSRNEPFGIVILEAWSAGKPVVACENGGPAELVRHDVNGYKVYPTSQSIAWGIGTLFADFEHGRWMGKNGRATAEKDFSWDIIADHTVDVYKS